MYIVSATMSTPICKECGNYTTNPLVAQGIIPDRLATILMPQPTETAPAKTSRRKVTHSRVLSTQDMLDELQVSTFYLKLIHTSHDVFFSKLSKMEIH